MLVPLARAAFTHGEASLGPGVSVERSGAVDVGRVTAGVVEHARRVGYLRIPDVVRLTHPDNVGRVAPRNALFRSNGRGVSEIVRIRTAAVGRLGLRRRRVSPANRVRAALFFIEEASSAADPAKISQLLTGRFDQFRQLGHHAGMLDRHVAGFADVVLQVI